MNQRVADILTRMKPRKHANVTSIQITDMAELLSILAEEQVEYSAKMERQTNKLIVLTRIIVFLTVGLLAYTAVLCFLTLHLTQ